MKVIKNRKNFINNDFIKSYEQFAPEKFQTHLKPLALPVCGKIILSKIFAKKKT